MITTCQWVQLGLSHLDSDKDEIKWLDAFGWKFTLKLWMCSIKLVRKWICGSVVWGDVVWTYLNDANVWVFWRSTMNSWCDWFSYYINLRMTRISSMDTIISSIDIPSNISNKKKDMKIIINIGLMESLFKWLWAQKWQRQKDFQICKQSHFFIQMNTLDHMFWHVMDRV